MVINSMLASMSDNEMIDYIKSIIQEQLDDDLHTNTAQTRWVYTCNIYSRTTDRLISTVYYLNTDDCHRLHTTCLDRVEITYNRVSTVDRDYAVAFHNSNYRRVCISQGVLVMEPQ